MFVNADYTAVNFLKRGDKKAFRQIYDRYHKSIFSLALRYLKDQHMAEDATQDIFIKLWISRGKLDPTKSLKSFLLTCLRNHVLNMIRNQKRRILAAYQLKEIDHPATSCTEDELQYNEYREILHNGLNKMPERRKEVFQLKMVTDLTNAQIAEKLQISIHTVKVHYKLGSIFIKSHLKKQADIRMNA